MLSSLGATRWRALVLCYHAVSEDWEHALSIRPAGLERQLTGLLRRGYRPARAEELLNGGARLLQVTFDDAFRSAALALPVLERLRIPATVFACPGFADGGRPLDVPELAQHARRDPDALATMDWDALRGLVEHGVEVGSHTVSHPHLPLLGDRELRSELVDSRRRLEDELHRPCRFLAYPFGDEDARVRAAAAAAGYTAAFALPGREDRIDRFALPRVGVYRGDTRLRWAIKTTGVLRRPAAAALRAAGRR